MTGRTGYFLIVHISLMGVLLGLLRCAPTEQCRDGEIRCDGACVNTAKNNLHCGGCHKACLGTDLCVEGGCQRKCDAATPTLCGEQCVSTENSNQHCGRCDNACGGSDICSSGSCGDSCHGNTPTLCGEQCVNTDTNNAHCGRCDHPCTGIDRCSSGNCSAVCEGSTPTLCGSICVDTEEDNYHCGRCDNACTSPQICISGDCSCADGATLCGSNCVNTDSDQQHCGRCNNACPGVQSCVSGDCSCADSETTLCGDACVNTDSDQQHCGRCNNACPGVQTCVSGDCSCADSETTVCGDACVNTDTDQEHCGRCDNACAFDWTCLGGACEPEVIDTQAIPNTVPTVEILVDQAGIDLLEADPFHAPDVIGTFVDGDGTRYEGVDINYRGAYALGGLINNGYSRRNWKVKFSSDQRYQNRREWNFNSERHLRHKLAYDVMKFAGVKVPDARHVLLLVNGTPHGLYVEYEDPDSKRWLTDKFGDNDGDLYKAAYDIPDETPYWALTTYLGESENAYFYHYRKKTNKSEGYQTIIDFLRELNAVQESEIVAWYEQNVDVEILINYLIVSNFISHWDSLPQRPKNYWLYQHPTSLKWKFIPWDLDGTFLPNTFPLNPMGTDASIYYQCDGHENYQAAEGEGTERPLVRRLMAQQVFRDRYNTRYRELLSTVLHRDFLLDRVTRLTALLAGYVTSSDMDRVNSSNENVISFINQRYNSVDQQLNP